MRQHPELITIDTIRDTVVTAPIHIDTVFRYRTGDTVVIEKENVRTELFFLPGDSIKVTTDKAPDTVYFEKPIPIIQANTDNIELLKETILKLRRRQLVVLCVFFVVGFVCAAFIFKTK